MRWRIEDGDKNGNRMHGGFHKDSVLWTLM